MNRTLGWAVAISCIAALVAVALYHGSWGALVMAVVGAALFGWYKLSVARSAAAEKFFDGAGEETRLTGIQGHSPSEMPVDPPPGGPDRAS